jgi:predicted Zn-dependent peptidase
MRKEILSDGLRIVTVPQAGTKTVSIVVLVGAGSRHETKKTLGLSHFLEHMVFKGTAKRPTFLDIALTIDRVGGIFNAYTGKEFTGFWAKVAAGHFDTALDIISDVIQHASLNPSDIEREKGVIIEEINMYEDSPRERIHYLLEEAIFPQNTLGSQQVGRKETVRAITRTDFEKYIETNYAANNVVVAVAGNFDEAKVISETKKAFNFQRKETKGDFEKISGIQTMPNVKIINKKTEQTHFSLGIRGFDNLHQDKYVGRILTVILGGGFSSRLFSEIREKRGLAYYVKGYDQSYSDAGYLAFQAGVDHSKLSEALKVALAEIIKIRDKGLDSGELEKAKEHFKGNLLIDMESSEELADFYAGKVLMNDEVDTLEKVVEAVDKISSDDIRRVAQDLFQTHNLNLAVIGDIKNEERLINLLKI